MRNGRNEATVVVAYVICMVFSPYFHESNEVKLIILERNGEKAVDCTIVGNRALRYLRCSSGYVGRLLSQMSRFS